MTIAEHEPAAVPRRPRKTAVRKASASAAPSPEFVEVSPGELVIGANVRLDPRLDKEFVASVAERGVLQAITAYRDGGGRLVVLAGQRRTLAAARTGRPTVPVMVIEVPGDVDRLTDQLAENDRRTGLDNKERIAAYEQMAAFGLSAEQIAGRTKDDAGTVRSGLRVAAAPAVRRVATDEPDLTLDQLAVIVEFDGHPEAVQDLTRAAKVRGSAMGNLEHQAQYWRNRIALEVSKTALAEELRAKGVKILTERPTSLGKVRRLAALKNNAGKRITPAAHARCKGNAAYVDDDWVQQDGEHVRVAVPIWACRDPEKAGHVYEPGPEKYSASGKPLLSEMDPDEAERERAERREVKENNAAWVAATAVRRQWVTGLLTRRRAPAGAAAFIAAAAAYRDCEDPIDRPRGLATGRELLGMPYEAIESWKFYKLPKEEQSADKAREAALFDAIGRATDFRALVLALGLTLGRYEEQATEKSSWRSKRDSTRRYLAFLASAGYPLADVERLACSEKATASSTVTAPVEDVETCEEP